MQKQYETAYRDISKFTKRVDILGKNQQDVHIALLKLQSSCNNDRKKFVSKFTPLRAKVFKNLRISEKILFEENKLNDKFEQKV